MEDKLDNLPLRRALLYAFLAGIWIIGSDRLLLLVTGDLAQTHLLQTVKGWFFVSVTAAFLYFVLQKDLSKLQREIETRRGAEAALRESETRLIRAQRIAGMGDFTLDLETQEISWSTGLYELVKYDPSDPISLDFIQKHIQHPEDSERVMSWLQGSITANSAELSPNEYRLVRKDGDIITVRTQGVIEQRDGKKPRIFGTAVDISEQVRAVAEREELQRQIIIGQKLETVGRLAGGVAHDFNNILSVIIGYTEMARDGLDTNDPLRTSLDQVLEAARRSTDITRQLLTFARKEVAIPRVVDLNTTVEGMLTMLRRLIGEDIDLVWRPGSDLGAIKIDPSQVDQLLANLCINARDAIDGIGKIIVETGMTALDVDYCEHHGGIVPGDYITLSVSDNGSGMSQETMKHVFEPFFTTKEEGKGTGLGLATVYGIVKQNDGAIHVYSEPGQGATFRIYLPHHPGKEEQEARSKPHSDTIYGTETILVVEDDQAILTLTEKMLGTLGYKILATTSPPEAIDMAKHYDGTIHLLMTDVVMPEMNGKELGELLLQVYPNLKILFTSGYTANVITHRGILDEAVNFISKPFSRQDVAQKIREVLLVH